MITHFTFVIANHLLTLAIRDGATRRDASVRDNKISRNIKQKHTPWLQPDHTRKTHHCHPDPSK